MVHYEDFYILCFAKLEWKQLNVFHITSLKGNSLQSNIHSCDFNKKIYIAFLNCLNLSFPQN